MDYSPTENGEQEVRTGQNGTRPGEFEPRFAPAFVVGQFMAELRLDGGNLSACGGINQFRLGLLNPGGPRMVHNHLASIKPDHGRLVNSGAVGTRSENRQKSCFRDPRKQDSVVQHCCRVRGNRAT